MCYVICMYIIYIGLSLIMRHFSESAFYYVNKMATKPAFKPWEINDNKERVKLELLTLPPEVTLV